MASNKREGFVPYFKKYLKTRGITQQELKEITGCAIGTMNKMCNAGEVKISLFRDVARQLEITEEELRYMLDHQEPMPQKPKK